MNNDKSEIVYRVMVEGGKDSPNLCNYRQGHGFSINKESAINAAKSLDSINAVFDIADGDATKDYCVDDYMFVRVIECLPLQDGTHEPGQEVYFNIIKLKS